MECREVSLQCNLRDLKPHVPELVSFALDAMGRLGMSGSVGFLLTGDRRMAQLNSKFRGKIGPTDVLSFPSGEADSDGATHIGDIAIGGRVAAAEAQTEGKTLLEMIKILILHGLLHLAGFDHESDSGQMRRKERDLRKALGLPL